MSEGWYGVSHVGGVGCSWWEKRKERKKEKKDLNKIIIL
mgnify:CR=1 FL=1